MKKMFKSGAIVASIVLGLGATSASAEAFVSAGYGVNSSGDKNILSIQPAAELVGDGGSQIEVRVGFSGNDYMGNEQSRAYLYGWNNPDKNGEVGFGVGGEWISRPFDNKSIGLVVGGQVGYGWQGVSGKEQAISTSATKVSFIVGNSASAPSVATYENDTYVLDIGLTLGTTYAITKNWSIDLGYVYKYSNYQVSYRTNANSQVLNELTFNQDNHMIRTGLNYRF